MTTDLLKIGKCRRCITACFLENMMQWLAGNWVHYRLLRRARFGWGSCRTHGSMRSTRAGLGLHTYNHQQEVPYLLRQREGDPRRKEWPQDKNDSDWNHNEQREYAFWTRSKRETRHKICPDNRQVNTSPHEAKQEHHDSVPGPSGMRDVNGNAGVGMDRCINIWRKRQVS